MKALRYCVLAGLIAVWVYLGLRISPAVISRTKSYYAQRRFRTLAEKAQQKEVTSKDVTKKEESVDASMVAEKPPTTEEEEVIPSLTEVFEEEIQNPDMVGVLTVLGTKIVYPVLLRDNVFYLDHGYDGKKDVNGAIFMDEKNHAPREVLDRNLVIYGHAMQTQTMFHDLVKFRDEAFAKASGITFTYSAEDGEKTLSFEILSVFEAKPLSRYRETVFEDDAAFQAYVQDIAARSMHPLSDKEALLLDAKGLITLSTCVFGSDEDRFVVVGVRKK